MEERDVGKIGEIPLRAPRFLVAGYISGGSWCRIYLGWWVGGVGVGVAVGARDRACAAIAEIAAIGDTHAVTACDRGL